jgi:cobalt-zinc-cadmium efflux system protein
MQLRCSRKWYCSKGLLCGLAGTFLWFLYSLAFAHPSALIGVPLFLIAAGGFVVGFNAICTWENCTAQTSREQATRLLVLIGIIASIYLQGAFALHLAHLSLLSGLLYWLLFDGLWAFIILGCRTVTHDEQLPHTVEAADPGLASGTLLAMRVAFFLTIGVIAVLFVGSSISHSLALLGDAFHNMVDLAAYGLGWYAARRVQRPDSARNTLGPQRFNVMAGHWNSLLLLGASSYILWEAFERFQHPQAVQGWIAIVCALIGIGANAVILQFMKQSDHQNNESAKAALADAIGDMAASTAVVLANIFIYLGWSGADTWCSSIVALIMVTMAWRIIRRTASVLLNQVPAHIDIEQVKQQIRAISGVVSLDAFHVIPHDGETHHTCISLTAEGEAGENVVRRARTILTQHGITDPTIAISTGTQ